MFGSRKTKVDPPKILDTIEQAVYNELKPYGFKKHGRTLHRFVSGDISQVINFQLGQSYRNETHLLSVNTGIRVPECQNRSFQAEQPTKQYFHEYECNIRSRLGKVEGKQDSCYDLRKPTEPILADILRQIRQSVLPVFEILISRDAILERRREFPNLDTMNRHLILLEEAMIYGRRGDAEQAEKAFLAYYHGCANGQTLHKHPPAVQAHLNYLERLAEELGVDIPKTG